MNHEMRRRGVVSMSIELISPIFPSWAGCDDLASTYIHIHTYIHTYIHEQPPPPLAQLQEKPHPYQKYINYYTYKYK